MVSNGSLNGQRYRDEIMQTHVVPYFNAHPDWTLMHDNARPHVARIYQQLLADNNIRVLDWPPYSPDMNPIEHVWDMLSRQMQRRVPAPTTNAQLRQEWRAIPRRQLDNILVSMP